MRRGPEQDEGIDQKPHGALVRTRNPPGPRTSVGRGREEKAQRRSSARSASARCLLEPRRDRHTDDRSIRGRASVSHESATGRGRSPRVDHRGLVGVRSAENGPPGRRVARATPARDQAADEPGATSRPRSTQRRATRALGERVLGACQRTRDLRRRPERLADRTPTPERDDSRGAGACAGDRSAESRRKNRGRSRPSLERHAPQQPEDRDHHQRFEIGRGRRERTDEPTSRGMSAHRNGRRSEEGAAAPPGGQLAASRPPGAQEGSCRRAAEAGDRDRRHGGRATTPGSRRRAQPSLAPRSSNNSRRIERWQRASSTQ